MKPHTLLTAALLAPAILCAAPPQNIAEAQAKAEEHIAKAQADAEAKFAEMKALAEQNMRDFEALTQANLQAAQPNGTATHKSSHTSSSSTSTRMVVNGYDVTSSSENGGEEQLKIKGPDGKLIYEGPRSQATNLPQEVTDILDGVTTTTTVSDNGKTITVKSRSQSNSKSSTSQSSSKQQSDGNQGSALQPSKKRRGH